jgi:2OG-Fe dioxygenase
MLVLVVPRLHPVTIANVKVAQVDHLAESAGRWEREVVVHGCYRYPVTSYAHHILFYFILQYKPMLVKSFPNFGDLKIYDMRKKIPMPVVRRLFRNPPQTDSHALAYAMMSKFARYEGYGHADIEFLRSECSPGGHATPSDYDGISSDTSLVGILVVHDENTFGARSAFQDRPRNKFITKLLPGQLALFDPRKVAHCVTPFRPLDEHKGAQRGVLRFLWSNDPLQPEQVDVPV